MKLTTLILATIVFISGCTWNKNRKKIDVTDIDIEMSVNRFEEDFFKIEPSSISEGLQRLHKTYPIFYPLFVEQIIKVTPNAKEYERYEAKIHQFLTNEAVEGLFDTVSYTFRDFVKIERELEQGLKYYKAYFPSKEIPKVVTFISEFGHGALTYEHILGIGLDMYLGKKYKYYPAIGFPGYMINRLEQDFIVINAMNVLATNLLDESISENVLLSKMIYEGKILYFLEQTLPQKEVYQLIGYTKEQLDWCISHEVQIWGFFIEKELLYSTQGLDFQRYTGDGPTTIGMPSDAPGNVGSWIGWQIVKKYMELHPNISMKELFEMNDAQKILNLSNYKPRK